MLGTSGGAVTIKAATPNLSGVTINDSTGAVTGSFDGGTVQNGTVNVGAIVAASGSNINIAGGNVNLNGTVNAQGGSVNVTSVSGNVLVSNNLSATGGNVVIQMAGPGSLTQNANTILSGNAVTLTTANLIENGFATAASGDLNVQSTAGNTLNVTMAENSLLAASGNVVFNGTTPGAINVNYDGTTARNTAASCPMAARSPSMAAVTP